ncbi:hypothetical protein [Falsiroseomonas tokyonensis]|uniref:Uncharacterized protein n=1 Tax=Falsiroseomonas tokyonensis TaxID=430521 RepID=A0ABV7BP14_9PROT|nr:hypothetical protein [Falsiroseomonas tokyonensis]
MLSEFSPDGALRALSHAADGTPRATTIAALLPDAFGPTDLR